jgi:ribosomal protein L7Ae-like RNA K-turn-binding protein
MDTFLKSGYRQVMAILATARRTGWLRAGRTALFENLDKHNIALVLIASDASDSLRDKVNAKATASHVFCYQLLCQNQLSDLNANKPLAVLGVTHRGLAKRLQTEIERVLSLADSINQLNLIKNNVQQLTGEHVRGKMSQKQTGFEQIRS